jgi:hypothetical protein
MRRGRGGWVREVRNVCFVSKRASAALGNILPHTGVLKSGGEAVLADGSAIIIRAVLPYEPLAAD